MAEGENLSFGNEVLPKILNFDTVVALFCQNIEFRGKNCETVVGCTYKSYHE